MSKKRKRALLCQPHPTRPAFKLEDGWLFQPPFTDGPISGLVFHPSKPGKGCHEAFCLGGVVICDQWKRSRRILGPAELISVLE